MALVDTFINVAPSTYVNRYWGNSWIPCKDCKLEQDEYIEILVMAHSSSIASILLVRISRVSIALASISMIFTGPANIKRYSLVLALSSLWKDSLLVLLPGMTL